MENRSDFEKVALDDNRLGNKHVMLVKMENGLHGLLAKIAKSQVQEMFVIRMKKKFVGHDVAKMKRGARFTFHH